MLCGLILAALTLFVLAPPATLAQYPGGGGGYSGGGYPGSPRWVIRYKWEGQKTATVTNRDGTTNPSTPQAWNVPDSINYDPNRGFVFPYFDSIYVPDGGSGTANISGTVTGVAKWCYDWDHPAPNPPSKVYLRQSGSAMWQVTDSTHIEDVAPHGSASNGLGNAEGPLVGYDPVTSTGGSSSGSHLIQRDGSSGIVEVPGSPSADVSATPPADRSSGTSLHASVGFSLVEDPRSVIVVSSLGTTYYKGADNQRVPNDYLASGAIKEDTVIPDEGSSSSISYGAVTGGTWGQPSSYEWKSQVTGASLSGLWNDPLYADPGMFGSPSSNGVPSFPVTYSQPPLIPGQIETVKVKVMDGQDAAEAENENLVIFHNPVEGWQRDSGYPKHHPLPASPSPQDYGDWTLAGTETNPTSQPQPGGKVTLSAGTSEANSGQIGSGFDLGLTVKAINGAFHYNENYSITDTYTFTASQDVTWTLPPNSRCYKFWAYGWTEHSGKCDIYQADGFRGVFGFSGVQYDSAPGDQPGISTYVWHENLPQQ